MSKAKTVGNRIAPARFLIFFAMLGISIAVATIVTPWWLSVMLGFDVSAVVFILSCVKLYRSNDHQHMRAVAVENDANRSVLLVLAFALAIVILVAVGSQMSSNTHTTPIDILITIVTLLTSWFFGNTVYALDYSHLSITPQTMAERIRLDSNSRVATRLRILQLRLFRFLHRLCAVDVGHQHSGATHPPRCNRAQHRCVCV